ncbi:MAG: ABC transporter substrate-binding protein [Burkholderiales bacterium]|nr:ABC transporter substrate-binding protein [Burkholderiales bacterium]
MKRSFFAALGASLLALAVAPAGLAQNSIRIAVLGPMAFVQGEHHWAGAEMARDEINKAGGITVGGRKLMVELIRADTNEMTSVPDAQSAAERVITRDRADFLIGGFRSEAVFAMQEVAMDHKKIFLGVGAAHDELGLRVERDYNRYKYWFRCRPPSRATSGRTVFAVLNAVAGEIRKQFKTETPKVAVLAEKAVWTEGLIAAAQKNLPAMKMEMVGLWQPSATATDVTAELSAIERAGADIVFTILSGPVGIVVGRQMGERNMKAVAFGINVEAQKDEFWGAAAGKANYVSTLNTYAEVEITPKTVPWVRVFQRALQEVARLYRGDLRTATTPLKQAIEQANSLRADDLVPVLEKIRYVGNGAVIEFDKRHDPVWGPGKSLGIGVQWQDGKLVAFWPPEIKGMQPFRLPPR